jgi:oligoendopeptidase F
VEAWLDDWSRLDALVGEAGTLAMIAYTATRRTRRRRRATCAGPPRSSRGSTSRGCGSRGGCSAWAGAGRSLETTLRRFRRDAEIFREANVPLFAELEELSAAYQKITGGPRGGVGRRAQDRCRSCQPFLKHPDRATRERAFRVGARPYLARRDELAALFDRMYVRRVQVAANAGFANFMEYCFAAKHRFDYTRDDVSASTTAVEETVDAAVERLMADRRRRLGLDVLRPWDTGVDLYRERPLKPFDRVDDFVAGARRVFDRWTRSSARSSR